MPSVRELAAADAAAIIADEGGGCSITLINSDGEHRLPGLYSDIGSLVDPLTGEPVQGRSIEITVSAIYLNTVLTKTPARGWQARLEKDGQVITLFVQRNEYDRTVELYRLTLGLQLEDKKE